MKKNKARKVKGEADATNYSELNLVTDFSSVGSGSWTIVDVVQVAAGTGEQDRNRSAIKVGNVHIDGTLVGGQTNSIADDPYNTVRIMVVRGAESLVSADWNAVSMNDPPLRIVFPKVREILLDKRFVISSYGPDSTGYMVKAVPVKCTIPINDIFYWYTSAATTHENESLFIAMRSDSGAVPNPGFVTPAKLWYPFQNVTA